MVKILIYPDDTQASIKNKTAYQLNTLPKYIFIENYPKVQNQESIEIGGLDLISYIQSLEDIDFLSFYNSIKVQYPFDMNTILQLWITYNPEVTEETLPFIQIELDGMNLLPIDTLFQNRKIFKNKIRDEIADFKDKQKEENKEKLAFDSIVPIKYTSFFINKTTQNYTTNLYAYDYSDLFNKLHTNENINLIMWGDIYKIGIVPIENLPTLEEEESIFIFIEDNKKLRAIKIKLENHTAHIILESKNQTIINKILSAFEPGTKIMFINQEFIQGVYYINDTNFNNYLFADVVMNNDTISKFLVINESLKASRKNNTVRVRYQDRIIFTLTLVTMNTKIIKTLRPDDISTLGSTFLRVVVSEVKDKKDIEQFQTTFGKIYTIYLNNLTSVFNFYKSFIPKFEKKEQTETNVKQKKRLKDIAPDLFLSNYSRKCLSPPEIIQESEVPQYEQEYQVMKFPKDSDGLPQHNYICQPRNGIPYYPGLKKNNMKNADIYPYIPCCYPVDQRLKKNSKYNQYYNSGVSETTEDKKMVYEFISDKFVPFDIYGDLSVDIKKLIDVIMPQVPNYHYMRKGVTRGKSSFLECVLVAINHDFRDTIQKERITLIPNLRKNLTNFKYLTCCKQEMYSYNINQIKEYLLDMTKYLDPSLFIKLLEEKYGFNIYIFNKDGFVIPKNRGGHLIYNRNNRKNILIYEHMGSESDMATYPQCEIIVFKSGNDVEYTFSQDIPQLHRAFNIVNEQYRLNKKINPFWFTDNIIPVSQTIDSFGKTRILKLKYTNKEFIILTEPIPPLNIPDEKLIPTKVSLKNISFPILSQSIENEKVIAVDVMIGNIQGTILIKPNDLLPSVPTKIIDISLYKEEPSVLQEFKRNKNYSNIITSYFFYLFSLYCFNNDIKYPTKENVDNFLLKNITINPNYIYKPVPQVFDINSGVMDNGKLVIISEDLLSRLLYILNLGLQQRREYILNYKDRNIIPNYYDDISNFITYPGEIILQGEDNMEKWINKSSGLYQLENKVIPNKLEPYFFLNKNMGNNMYLLQGGNSLQSSLDVDLTWDLYGYNKVIGSFNKMKDFTLYSYINQDNIKKYNIGSKNEKLRVIGYKYKGLSQFISLLKI